MDLSQLTEFLYEDIEPRVTDVRDAGSDGLEIDVACDSFPDAGPRRFRITAEGVIDRLLMPTSFSGLSLHETHPLLLDHLDAHRVLTFSSAPEVPEAVVGRLYETHRRVCGDWRPLSAYVNDFNGAGTSALLKTGFGLLASGPGSLMETYRDSVSGLLRTSLSAASPPRLRKFKALVFDEYYVLAREFRSEEVAAP